MDVPPGREDKRWKWTTQGKHARSIESSKPGVLGTKNGIDRIVGPAQSFMRHSLGQESLCGDEMSKMAQQQY